MLVFVFFLIFCATLFVRPQQILRYLGSDAGLRGYLVAAGAGIVSAGPIYLWYPMLADLSGKGMRRAYIATFLYARAIKIPLIPLMVYYFGVLFTVMFTLYLFVVSIPVGAITGRLSNRPLPPDRND